MSNYPALSSAAPSYINAAKSAAFLEEAIAGIGGGVSVPSLRAKGTRFVLRRPDVDDEMLNVLELPIFVLKAKGPISKKFYLTKYVEGQEPVAPDCFSMDGIKPDPSCSAKQCESCAGCPQNVFGSGTAADGTPGKGKACSDTKELAVFVNKKGIFQLGLMPTALRRWVEYCKQLGAHGRSPADVITILGFDASASFPSYTFTYGGDISEAAYPKIQAMAEQDEVKAIIERGTVQAALPAPGAAQGQIENKDEVAAARARKEAEEKAAAEKKAADAKAKKDADAKAKKDADAKAKKDADAKKAADLAAAAVGSADNDDLDLLGGADPGPANVASAATDGMNADTADVISALGLDLD